jgi:tetratricopeptide (TPR) repeat protein
MMLGDHLSIEELQAFLLSRPERDGARRNMRVIRHLLAGCAECQRRIRNSGWEEERLERLLTLPSAELDEPTARASRFDYDAAFAHAETKVAEFLASERLGERPPGRTIEALLAELGFLPRDEQLRLTAEEPRFARPQLVRRLLEQSHTARYQDPAAMLERADLARAIAAVCSPDSAGGARRLADLRSLAFAHFGNALRVTGKLAEAETALAEAEGWRERGTGDPLLRGTLREYMAQLRYHERRIDSALALSEEACQVYRDLGEGHDLARGMVLKAMAYQIAAETESAVRLLNRAVPLIEQDRDPYLMLAALHNLVGCYIDLDRPEDAMSLRAETRHLYEDLDDEMLQLRASWQDGQLLRALGRLANAESALLRARQGFLDHNLPYPVAVLSLDLAAVYLRMGRSAETRDTIEEALPIFRSLGVGRDTLAALIQLRQLADREDEALGLIRLIASQLRRTPQRLSP